MIRKLLLNLLVTITTALHAAEPKELTDLKTAYDAEVKRTLQPVNDRYLRSLTKLKETFTKGAKLEQAISVDAEIKRIEGSSPIPTTPNSNPTAAIPEVKSPAPALANTTWIAPKAGKIVFRGGGNMQIDHGNGKLWAWTWETAQSGEVLIKDSHGIKKPIKFKRNGTRFDYNDKEYVLEVPKP